MKNAHLLLVGLFAVAFLPLTIFSAGIIDQTFGTNGTLNLNFGNQTNIVDVETKPDGKIVVAGTVANVTSGKDIVVAQFNPNGTPDTNFGTNGRTISVTNLDETITDLEVQSDGKIVVVGQRQAYEGVNGIFDFLVVRYDAKGLLDSSFGIGGFGTFNQNQLDKLAKVAILPDGKIVVVGSTIEVDRIRVVIKLDANGTADSGFGSNGFWFQTMDFNPNIDLFSSGFLDVEPLSGGGFIAGFNTFRGHPDEDEFSYTLVEFSPTGFVSSLTKGRLGFFGAGLSTSLDFEFSSSGAFGIVSQIGTSINNRQFNSFGSRLTTLNNGNFVVSGVGFPIKLYSSSSYLGTALNLSGGNVAAQSNGNFLIITGNSIAKVRTVTSQATRLADFDNNGRTDLIVDRFSTNKTYFLRGNGSYLEFTPIFSSSRKFIPEYCEFQFVTGLFAQNLIRYRTNGVFYPGAGPVVPLGGINDLAVGGDYNGDGLTDFSVFTPSGDWVTQIGQLNPSNRFFHWGTTGDKPVPADYDYDGITDYAVYRPSTGVWWIHRSSDDSHFGVQFGLPTDIPLTGDYDADGKADLAVFRPSNGFWYLLMTTDGFKAVQFGISTDIPTPGDYDGDGKHDIAVFRNGIWYLLQSRDGFAGIQWGQTGDVPVTVRYDN